jgi:predicted dehydrogenase
MPCLPTLKKGVCMKKILLVGLGRVGWTYDLATSTQPGNSFLTHYKSLKNIQEASTNSFELYVHDYSQDVYSRFSDVEKGGQFLQTEDELLAHAWDLVVVATNTNQILKIVEKFATHSNATKFLVEKPVAKDLDTLRNFVNANVKTSLLERIRVGFPRRTLNSSKQIKDIFAQYTKEELSFKITFSGGVSNIFSHFLDLSEYWLGAFQLIDIDVKSKFALLGGINHPEITMEVYQSGETNNEDTTIVSKKRDLLRYSDSGRFIEIYDTEKKKKVVFEGEIERMLLPEAIEYVNWGLYDKPTVLTRLPSSSIEIALALEATFANP